MQVSVGVIYQHCTAMCLFPLDKCCKGFRMGNWKLTINFGYLLMIFSKCNGICERQNFFNTPDTVGSVKTFREYNNIKKSACARICRLYFECRGYAMTSLSTDVGRCHLIKNVDAQTGTPSIPLPFYCEFY